MIVVWLSAGETLTLWKHVCFRQTIDVLVCVSVCVCVCVRVCAAMTATAAGATMTVDERKGYA